MITRQRDTNMPIRGAAALEAAVWVHTSPGGPAGEINEADVKKWIESKNGG